MIVFCLELQDSVSNQQEFDCSGLRCFFVKMLEGCWFSPQIELLRIFTKTFDDVQSTSEAVVL